MFLYCLESLKQGDVVWSRFHIPLRPMKVAIGWTFPNPQCMANGTSEHFSWMCSCLIGGFKYFFLFNPSWGRFPCWLIFFQMGWNHQLLVVVVSLFKQILPWDSSPFLFLKGVWRWKVRGPQGMYGRNPAPIGMEKPAVNKGINYLSTGSF